MRSARRQRAARRAAVWFLLGEAALALVWWAVLVASPSFRARFWPEDAGVSIFTFALPDGVLYIGAALVGAYGLARRASWSRRVLGIHTGAACYAALFAIALSARHPSTWLGALLMAPALVVLPLIVVSLGA